AAAYTDLQAALSLAPLMGLLLLREAIFWPRRLPGTLVRFASAAALALVLAAPLLAGVGGELRAGTQVTLPLHQVVRNSANLLALGPSPHLGGAMLALPFGLPSPYSLFEQLPLVGIGRTPARFMGPALLCLALLTAWGVLALRQRVPSAARLVAPAAALLVLF